MKLISVLTVLSVIHTVLVKGLSTTSEERMMPTDFHSLNMEDHVVYPVEAALSELLTLSEIETLFDPPNRNVDVDIGVEKDSLRNAILMSNVSKLSNEFLQDAFTVESPAPGDTPLENPLDEIHALERPSKVHLVVTLTTTSTTYVEEARSLAMPLTTSLATAGAITTVTVTSTELEQVTLLLSIILPESSHVNETPELHVEKAVSLSNSEPSLVPLTANAIREIFKETLLGLRDEISKKFANNGNNDGGYELNPDPFPRPLDHDDSMPVESEQLDVNDIHNFIKELMRTVDNDVTQSMMEYNGPSDPPLMDSSVSTLEINPELVDEVEQDRNLIETYGLGGRDLKEIEKYEKFLSLSRFKDLPEDIITDIIDFVRAKDKHQFIDNFRHRPFLKGIAIDVTSTDDNSKSNDDHDLDEISNFEETQQDLPQTTSEDNLNANGLLSSVLEKQISSNERSSEKKSLGKKKKLKKTTGNLKDSLEQPIIPNKLKSEDRNHIDDGFTSLDQKFTTKFNKNNKKALNWKKKASSDYDNVEVEKLPDDFYNPEAELFDGFKKLSNKEDSYGRTSGTNHNSHLERNTVKASSVEDSINSQNMDIPQAESSYQLTNVTVSDGDSTKSTSSHPTQPTREALEDPSIEENYTFERTTGHSDNHHRYMGALLREQLETNAKSKLKQRENIHKNPSLLFDKTHSGPNKAKIPSVGAHYKGEFFDFTSNSTSLRVGVFHSVWLIVCWFILLFSLLA